MTDRNIQVEIANWRCVAPKTQWGSGGSAGKPLAAWRATTAWNPSICLKRDNCQPGLCYLLLCYVTGKQTLRDAALLVLNLTGSLSLLFFLKKKFFKFFFYLFLSTLVTLTTHPHRQGGYKTLVLACGWLSVPDQSRQHHWTAFPVRNLCPGNRTRRGVRAETGNKRIQKEPLELLEAAEGGRRAGELSP